MKYACVVLAAVGLAGLITTDIFAKTGDQMAPSIVCGFVIGAAVSKFMLLDD